MITLPKIWVGNSTLYGTGGCKFEQNFRNSEPGSKSCRGPVVSLLYATKWYRVNGPSGKLVSDKVAGVKGPAKTVCRQIMLKTHFQI